MSTPTDPSPPSNSKLPASGWFPTDNDVADRVKEIGFAAFTLYSILRRHSEIDSKGHRSTNRKTDTLAGYLGVSQRHVRTLAGDIERAGLIVIEKRRGEGGKQRANRYHFPDTSPPTTAGTVVPKSTNSRNCGSATAGTVVPTTAGTVVPPFQEPSLSSQKPSCSQEREPAKAGDPPKGLLELIDGWNGLGDLIVKPGNGARRDPPAKAALTGWKRAQRELEQREAFGDVPKVVKAIRQAKFCHGQGWFSLPWLFKKNQGGEFNIERLLAGAHNEGSRNGNKDDGGGPGKRHDPSRPAGDPRAGLV